MIPSDPIFLLAVPAAGVVLFGLTFVVARRPEVGLWVFFAAALGAIRGWGPGFGVGGIQIYPLDAVSVVLVAAVAIRSLRLSQKVPVLPLMLLAMVIISTARGLTVFGMQQAVNSSRSVFYLAVAILFASTCFGRQMPTLQRVWKVAAALLLVSAASFLATRGLGNFNGDRALNSSEALLVAQAGLMVLHHDHSIRGRWFVAACLGAVVLSQQRTVWATIAVMVVVYSFQPTAVVHRRMVRAARRVLGVAVVAVVLLVVAGPPVVRDRLGSAISPKAVSATEHSTLAWRLQSWEYLTDEIAAAPLVDQVAGLPMGAPLTRVVGGLERTESAHNMYVMTLIWIGGAGLVLVLALFWQGTRRSYRRDPVLVALVAGLAVFSIGYQLGPISGLILGVAVVTGASSRSGARSLVTV